MAKILKSPVLLRKNIRKPLSLVDVECPVCRDVFIEPVTLPCEHRFCLQCFDGTMENVSLRCPMCRTRVGGWLRAATKDNSVVDAKLWELIKCEFPEYVEAKLRGETREIRSDVHPICVSQPGEIRREYELYKKAIEEEQRRQREEEERSSSDLIKKIQEEENEELNKKTMKIKKSLELDEEIARKMILEEMNRFKVTSPGGSTKKTVQISLESKAGANQPKRTDNKENKALKCSTSTIKGPMDIFLGKKKASSITMKPLAVGSTDNVKDFLKHEFVADGEKSRSLSSLSTGSCDSINQEMHHFKPIKVAPRTPPKQMPDGRVIEPKLVKITPVHVSPCVDDKSGRKSLQRCLKSGEISLTSKVDFTQVLLKSNVVRELFPSGISPNEPRGPSAFCDVGTGVLEIDKGCEMKMDAIGAVEPKIPKTACYNSIEAKIDEEMEEDESKHPLRKRKRKIQPCDLGSSGQMRDDESLLINMPHTSNKGIGEGSSSQCDAPLIPLAVNGKDSSMVRTLLEQQYQIESKLRQEREDLELAQRLQREWDGENRRVDRRKGSYLEYDLRRKLPLEAKDKQKGRSRTLASKVTKSPVRGSRQRLLEEVMSPQSKVAK